MSAGPVGQGPANGFNRQHALSQEGLLDDGDAPNPCPCRLSAPTFPPDRAPACPRPVSTGSLHLCPDQPGSNSGLHATESETLVTSQHHHEPEPICRKRYFGSHKNQPIQRVPLQRTRPW